jgi:hypothetical protein
MSLPARLYKYESFSAQSIENLKNQVLYFNSPLRFNDPYDCAVFPSIAEPNDSEVEEIRAHYLAINDLEPKVRVAFERTSIPGLRIMLLRMGQDVLDRQLQEFVSKRGISCFAEKPDNLLMWSHYADQHKGFCLEFRTDLDPFTKVRQVKYTNSMPQFSLTRMLCDRDFDEVLDLYCCKAQDWQYEREWRCIHNEAGTAYTYKTEALVGVYMGSQSSFTALEIVALILAGQNTHVQLWQGSRSKSEFAVEFQTTTYTPHLEAKRRGLL